ncbi:MAG TPA: serine/threonine-protein kinase, partial [Gemmatimonadales bacterium]
MTVLERLRTALAPGIAVEREIAHGGMGIVLLGRDMLLDRTIAIKVLRPELVTAVSAERFLREARHAAALRHPNVVRVHHADEADGLHYYTMDYIAGETLASRLAGGRLPAREAVRVGLNLLAALAAAHRHKLIHRDVKPSNIFLTPGSALLGDFGVAHALDSSSTALTQPGSPVGTLAYISPEQLRDQPVTERTDIYAVGLVLYEAITGTRWQPLADPARGDWSALPRHLRGPI